MVYHTSDGSRCQTGAVVSQDIAISLVPLLRSAAQVLSFVWWSVLYCESTDGLACDWVNASAIDRAKHVWFGTHGGPSEFILSVCAIFLPIVLRK